jgi:hypothetical protein
MSETILEYVTRLADQLSPEEKQTLVERLTESLAQEQGQEESGTPVPLSLRGLWQKHFPDDFDIDGALHEIRHDWEQEWPEVFNK